MAKQVNDDKKFTGIRLPKTIKPIHYDITLHPNLSTFTLWGNVKIKFESQETTKQIVLHANELEIDSASIYTCDDKLNWNLMVAVYYSRTSETVTLEFMHDIVASGILNIMFTGILNDKMKGFYRTSFEVADSTVYAASTHFEPTGARRCFPCWDEPEIKATFSINLIIDEHITIEGRQHEVVALSNMPEVERLRKGNTLVRFAETPIMSTYLLAFIVGPFEAIESSDGRRPIRVFTTPGKKEQGRFALDFACKALPYYEEYFGVSYDLPKMDLIAIPDFPIGAMENWGLVTYREICLLVDPLNTSAGTKQFAAEVIAHELSHQWFGNLVTMKWWTDLWLKEGFASFMQYLCTDHIHPEFDIWSQFADDTYARAMELDALRSSHPIEVPVNHPSEIDEIFDAISYSKGASVIRMLYNYIGDAHFRKGMNDYLTKFAYKNATTEDLWDCLGAASGRPVRRLMSGWTKQVGFPWLSIKHSVQGQEVRIDVSQSKFTADGKVLPDDANSSWMIPISVVTGKDPERDHSIHLLDGNSMSIKLENADNTWLKLNRQSIGLYRTAYPQEMFEKLCSAIEAKSLPPLDRLSILSDYFALCQAGKASSVQLLQLLKAYQSETEYTVWSSIDSAIARLSTIVSSTDFYDKLSTFSRELFSQIFKEVTWSPKADERHTDAMLRSLVLNRLVASGDQEVIDEARRQFTKAYWHKEHTIPADLRGAVYRAVSTYGDDDEFSTLFRVFRSSELHEERNRISRALGFVKTKERINRVIQFVTSDEVRIQDKKFVIIPLGSSNPAVAWKFFQDKKEFIREKYESGNIMRAIVKATTENFVSEEKAKEIEEFFERNKFPGSERTVQQSLETIRINAGWLSRDGESIKAFLSSY